MADRWIDVSGYELAKVGDRYVVLMRGGKHVRPYVADDEATLTVVGEAQSYATGLQIVKALRLTLAPVSPQVPEEGATDEG